MLALARVVAYACVLSLVAEIKVVHAQECQPIPGRMMSRIRILPGKYVTYQFKKGGSASTVDTVFIKDIQVKAWAIDPYDSVFSVSATVCTLQREREREREREVVRKSCV